jgi:curved DNA-binding protein CbpA
MTPMSFLREPGDLAQTPLAAILLEAWNLRLAGELTVHQAGGDSRLFFRDGVPVGAQTFAGFHPLGQVLLGQGAIDIETLGRSLAEMARTGRRQGEVLVEMGAVRQEAVDRALEAQQAGYVSLIAGLVEGAFRFSVNAPVPEWAGSVLLAPLRAVVDALASPQAASLVQSALAQVEGTVALGSGYAELESSFAWTEPEAAGVRKLAAAATAKEIQATPGLSRDQARAVLAALLLLGLAEPAGEVFEISSLGAGTSTGTRTSTGTGSPRAPPEPVRRSDPEVARARRQRLLARAMQNMGVGPLSAGPRAAAASAAKVAAANATAASSPPTPAEREIRRALEAALPLARDTDLFARLGLPRGATTEDVKGAYLRLVKQFHPDRYGSPALADLQAGLRDVLSALNEAYATLSDRARRTDYLARSASGGRAATEATAAAARADFQKGEAARRTGDHARARLFFESAVRGDQRADYLVALAAETLVSGKPEDRDRARRHLAEAMKDPTCSGAFLAAGIMAREENDPDRAEKLFRASLKADPRNDGAARELHEIQGRRSVRAEARSDAKK